MILLSRLASIFLLGLIVFATLSPIGLRPHIGDPDFERAAAYLLLGAALALGFPRHGFRVACLVVTIAAGLELLQLIDPGRHGRIQDAVIKAVAGLIGIGLISLAGRIFRRQPS